MMRPNPLYLSGQYHSKESINRLDKEIMNQFISNQGDRVSSIQNELLQVIFLILGKRNAKYQSFD